MLIRVSAALDLLVMKRFLCVPTDFLKFWYTVDRVDCQAEAVGLIVHGQFHRSVDVAFFFIAAHMQVSVICTTVGKTVN